MRALRCVVLGLVFLLGAARGAPADEALGGRYVLLQTTTVIAKVPVVPDLVTETRVVSLLDLAHEGSRLKGAGMTCQVEMVSSSQLVRTELPLAFRRILPAARLDARLERVGAELRLHQGPSTVVLGAKLENPRRDPLPTSADDPRVYDQDRDGHPGVTVRVAGVVSGEVYFAQRGVTELRGRREGRVFSGRVHFKTEDAILGASSALLKMRTNTRPDYERSTFRLVPVPPGTTCSEARGLAARWF